MYENIRKENPRVWRVCVLNSQHIREKKRKISAECKANEFRHGRLSDDRKKTHLLTSSWANCRVLFAKYIVEMINKSVFGRSQLLGILDRVGQQFIHGNCGWSSGLLHTTQSRVSTLMMNI